MAGPFKYDGYNVGGATLTLPPQSNVVINFTNKDGTPHSAVVVDGGGALPNEVSDPVIPGAYTVTPLQGLPQEGKDVMKFKVPATGQYRIACGVPGHALSGMWIWMKVDSSATVATFGPTK
ncbi:MAG: sulfocyanin-like copper-binding protein [Gemmatimonadota bacterium]